MMPPGTKNFRFVLGGFAPLRETLRAHA